MSTTDRVVMSASRIQAEFEFDQQKSAENKEKHGIDFIEAQALWKDPHWIEALAERRFLTIGKINGKHWLAVFTCRCERRRIISVRRARKKEIAQYVSTTAVGKKGKQ